MMLAPDRPRIEADDLPTRQGFAEHDSGEQRGRDRDEGDDESFDPGRDVVEGADEEGRFDSDADDADEGAAPPGVPANAMAAHQSEAHDDRRRQSNAEAHHGERGGACLKEGTDGNAGQAPAERRCNKGDERSGMHRWERYSLE